MVIYEQKTSGSVFKAARRIFSMETTNNFEKILIAVTMCCINYVTYIFVQEKLCNCQIADIVVKVSRKLTSHKVSRNCSMHNGYIRTVIWYDIESDEVVYNRSLNCGGQDRENDAEHSHLRTE